MTSTTTVSEKRSPAIAAPDESVKISLLDYLRQLGLQDTDLLNTLSEDCLSRAEGKIAPDSPPDELLRRALEEAQRRFDYALMQTFNLTSKDYHPAAGIRSALFLNGDPSDFLFRPEADQSERIARLKMAVPMATPPEAHLDMTEQPISFFFDSSHKTSE